MDFENEISGTKAFYLAHTPHEKFTSGTRLFASRSRRARGPSCKIMCGCTAQPLISHHQRTDRRCIPCDTHVAYAAFLREGREGLRLFLSPAGAAFSFFGLAPLAPLSAFCFPPPKRYALGLPFFGFGGCFAT